MFFEKKSLEEMNVVYSTMNFNNEQVFGAKIPESNNEKLSEIETNVSNKLE